MDAGLRVEPLSRTDDWRRVIDDHPNTTAFHTLAWRQAVAECFDYEPAYRLVYRDGEPVAALPGFRVGGLTSQVRVTPFCAYGHPLLSEAADPEQVLKTLEADRGGREILLIKDADWTGITGYSRCGYGGQAAGITRRLPTTGDYDQAREHVFDRQLRSGLDTAREAGFAVEADADPDGCLDEIYELHLATVRRHGSPQFPRGFFDALCDAFGERARLFLVRDGAELVASLLAFDAGGTRFLWNNASDGTYWDQHPNDLVYATAVRDAFERADCKVVDFGRTEPGSGVDRFKQKFGADPVQLTTMAVPPRHASMADISGYKQLQAITRRLAPVITHPAVGPRLKEWIHE